MIWRIEVFAKKRENSLELESQIKDLGFKNFSLTVKKIYFIDADFNYIAAKKIATSLLIDPIKENFVIKKGIFSKKPFFSQLTVIYQPGIFDVAANSLQKAIKDLSLRANEVCTATFYQFSRLSKKQIDYIGPRILYNPVVEEVADYEKLRKIKNLSQLTERKYFFKLKTIAILEADSIKLKEISRLGCLSLNLAEMRKIQNYYRKLKRNPTDCELETLAVLWSEHCGHKTFTGRIDYQEKQGNRVTKKEKIDNLLKTTIMKATCKINSPDCVSVFKDNAGIIKFDKNENICFKVETHNHPSSLEPYGGATTGVGGVIRDVLGTGCGFRPFALTDVFCFSPWHLPGEELPEGLLHPRRIIKGVISGVRDYGNRMGVPTVAGSVFFDQRFLGNPLVYCGALGIAPADKAFKKVKKGDLIAVCGAKTGKDGIHGATFSSQQLDQKTTDLRSAVQIGNPIEEKKVTDALMRARQEGLFTAITDCGAGGLSSAVTELAKGQGAFVHLDKVPLKYKGLSYTDVWISESQERMVFFTSPKNIKRLKEIFAEEDVVISFIGQVANTNKLILFYKGKQVAKLDMDFIFDSLQDCKKAIWIKPKEKKEVIKEKKNYNNDLAAILSSPNVAPKDWILSQYDHEVQGGSVLKSIGRRPFELNDAAVLRPNLESDKAVAIGCGINPFYSDLDPYWMAALAIDEALRNVVSSGAVLEKTFILDNFSWGSPENPNILGGLVRAAKACYDYSLYFGTPFISGKDSLYNEYDLGKIKITIPGTLLISAVSVLENWQSALGSAFKEKDNLIYLFGLTKPELGGSEYFRFLGKKGGVVPKIEPAAKDVFRCLSKAAGLGLIESCHDLAEGGIGVALSEMCLGSRRGALLYLKEIPKKGKLADYQALFSESPSRFLVEVKKSKEKEFNKFISGVDAKLVGTVSKEKKLTIYNKNSQKIVDCNLANLEKKSLATFSDFKWNLTKKNS